MKKILLLCWSLFLVQLSMGQNCTVVPSAVEFQQQYNIVNAQTTDLAKLNYLKYYLHGRCLMADQAGQLATLFYDDGYRLTFAEEAYRHMSDKANYFSLFDSFHGLSAAFRFYDYVNNGDHNVTANTQNVPPPPPPVQVLSFPNYNYPSPVNYSGMAGCKLPLSDNDFRVLVKPVADNQGDNAMMTGASQFVAANCISMAQLMELASLLQLEMNRSAFLKQNFLHVYDLGNYQAAAQVFTSPTYQADWNAWAAAQLTALSAPPPPPPCFVSEGDMHDITGSISKLSFSSTKLSTAKQIISAKKCFTTRQIKELVKLMTFEGDKLDLAKYAYDYCVDTNNYFLVNDVFDFDSSKTELSNYVQGKH